MSEKTEDKTSLDKKDADGKAAVTVKPKFATRDVALKRSGVTVSIPEDWHMSDTQAAQRYGAGDSAKTNMALIQRVCLFNGEKWKIADMQDRITGKDWMQLLGEIYGDDDEANAPGKE